MKLKTENRKAQQARLLESVISRFLGSRGEEDTLLQYQYTDPKNNAISLMFRPLR